MERTARPSAPPICCEVLISPLARPCSRCSTPETAAIVEVTKPKPSPIAASSDGPRMSVRKPPPTDTWLNQSEAERRSNSMPDRQDRLEAEPGDELAAEPRRDDDRQRQRQVGEAGVDRAVAEHLLHVEGDEEEHREQRGAEQEPDDVRAGQGPQPEDPEGNQRRLRAQLDGDEGADQGRGERQQADDLGGAPARAAGVEQRVGEHREAGGDGHRAGGVEVARRRLGAALGDQAGRERQRDRAPPGRSPRAPTPSRGRR